MKLYTTTLAPNPRSRIFMEEKGIEIPVQEITLWKENINKKNTKISPSFKVPHLN